MYLKKFEYFILDSSVAGTLLLMALAIRIEAINAGFDQFSSNIIFISVFIISTGLYISMQIALYEIIIYLCHHSKSLSIHEHLNDSVIAPEQAFMEYEKLRSNTIIEQKRTNDKKLELVHIYTSIKRWLLIQAKKICSASVLIFQISFRIKLLSILFL